MRGQTLPRMETDKMSLSPAAQATVDKINLLAARVQAVVADDANHAAASAALEAADLVGVNNALDNLNASLPKSGPGGPVLGLNPTSVSLTTGSPSATPVAVEGGTPPYSASGLPAGLSFDGSNLESDGTAAVGDYTATISDSSSPAITGTLTVGVAAAPIETGGGLGDGSGGAGAGSQGTGSQGTETTALAVSPTAVSFSVGVAGTQALAITGGVAPYSVGGLPPGVTFDGENLVADNTTTAADVTATVSDSSTPPEQASVAVTIQ